MLKTIQNVKISAIATCVPAREVDIYDNKSIYEGNLKKLNKVVKATGFHKRHILDENSHLTAGDLCIKAAEKLFENGFSKEDISAVIMVTQYPDYFEPATACVAHGKLGLPDSCIAFDINQGCCGFLFGLLVASNIIDNINKKILLLCGDTASKILGSQINAIDDIPIFGDGSCACILEYDTSATPMCIEIGTKGNDYDVLITKNGGYRNPPKLSMFDSNGNFQYDNYMDGLKVFDFTMNIVPPSINHVMAGKNWQEKDVNYYILHQANKMILENIATSANIDVNKVLRQTLSKYGNLSCASIPSVICDEHTKFNNKQNNVVLSGFGVGLSWGSAALTLDKPLVLPIIYY